jgi:hypothetical protein
MEEDTFQHQSYAGYIKTRTATYQAIANALSDCQYDPSDSPASLIPVEWSAGSAGAFSMRLYEAREIGQSFESNTWSNPTGSD